MNKKSLLIMPLAIFELLTIALYWILVFIKPDLARKIIKWSIRTLPDEDWYDE